MHRVVTVSGRSPGGSRCKVSAMAQRRAHVVWSERDQGTPNTPVHRPETPRKHRGNPSRTMRGDGDTLAPPSAASTLLDAGAGWRWVALGGATRPCIRPRTRTALTGRSETALKCSRRSLPRCSSQCPQARVSTPGSPPDGGVPSAARSPRAARREASGHERRARRATSLDPSVHLVFQNGPSATC